MALLTKHGTVSVEREQVGADLHYKVSDIFGYTKAGVIKDAMVAELDTAICADLHRRFSWAVTRRN